ncbi:MAG: hypothetical protein AAGC43_17300 [Bacteroidota bacterium]
MTMTHLELPPNFKIAEKSARDKKHPVFNYGKGIVLKESQRKEGNNTVLRKENNQSNEKARLQKGINKCALFDF